ncbi:MAG: nucleotidyltransferase domain-containing protein [Deltaproteobacteria bacterium]|nr:MAG: nucleotidyltransferase domain-containing protein [Deltaproteobacteria bacterium]
MTAREDQGKILSQIVTSLKEGLGERLVAIVLYGSRARGQARQASDWDLFIIASDLPAQLWERHILLKRFLPAAYRGAVSLLAKTPLEFEEKISSLYLDIAQDGQILFDPHGYARQRLAELQRLITETGLYRKQSPGGEVWRWRQKPPQPWAIEWRE